MTDDVGHDNPYCADSNASEDEWKGHDTGCHGGDLYGPCGDENCYGQCESYGICPCKCHGWNNQ